MVLDSTTIMAFKLSFAPFEGKRASEFKPFTKDNNNNNNENNRNEQNLTSIQSRQ